MVFSAKTSKYNPLTARGLMLSESPDEYDALVAQFISDTKPRGMVERTFIREVAHLTFEVMRYRRIQMAHLNASYKGVLARILKSHIDAETEEEAEQKAEEAANEWCTSEAGRRNVSKLLRTIGLDEAFLEARVIENCTSDIEALDRAIATVEARRIKAIQIFADYRASFAKKAQEVSNDLIENETARVRVHRIKKEA